MCVCVCPFSSSSNGTTSLAAFALSMPFALFLSCLGVLPIWTGTNLYDDDDVLVVKTSRSLNRGATVPRECKGRMTLV